MLLLFFEENNSVSSMSAMEAHVPSHPGLFEVDFKEGYYCSALIARKVRLSDTNGSRSS
jgi:hypothetical protein